MSSEKNTSPATLATAKHGGCVQLGDGLLPCPFCGNGAEFVPYKNNGLTLKCKSMGCIQRHQRTLRYGIEWLRTSMTEHWNGRALSAQPSPGGQGAPEIEQLRALVSSVLSTVSLGHQKGPYAYAGEDFGRYLAEAGRDCRQILRALSDLAALQPVCATVKDSLTVGGGQPAGEQRAALWIQFAENGNIRFWTKDQDRALAESFLHARPLTAFYASPQQPAQAVDLPYSIDADPAGIRGRVADCITGTLMAGAQGHTPPPAGHWAEPFWQAARADATAKAVDLGQQQDAARWRAIAPHLSVEWDEDEMLKRWTWIDFKGDALSVPTRTRESYASVDEAMDAVIDSQAVGNG